MSQSAERFEEYRRGDLLFSEGEEGGDLFLIESGEVEIFTVREGRDITFTVMVPGELVGIFTCLNRSTRNASARAVTEVRCKIIPHDRINRAIGDLPKWFAIIVKEYALRLRGVNEIYTEQVLTVERFRKRIWNAVTEGRLVAQALYGTGRMIAVQADDIMMVPEKAALELLAETLGFEMTRLALLMDVLKNSGLIITTTHPDTKDNCIAMSVIERLNDFPSFCRRAESGKSLRMVNTPFSNKVVSFARALVKYAQKKGLVKGVAIMIPIKDLVDNLRSVTGQKYEESAADFLMDFSLLKVIEADAGEEHGAIDFNPRDLGRIIASVVCYQKLLQLDDERVATGGHR